MKFNEIDWDLIQSDYDSGLTLRQVGKRHKIGNSSIHKAQKSGLLKTTRKRSLSEEHRKKLSDSMKKAGIRPPTTVKREISSTKACTKCTCLKPINQFHKKDGAYDGRQSICKSCRNIHGRKYMCKPHINKKLKKRKEEIKYRNQRYIKEYLSMHSCKCGVDDIRLLEFHHLKNKKYEVHQMVWHKLESIDKEIAKCVVLCVNCHRRETNKDNPRENQKHRRAIKYKLIEEIHGTKCVECGLDDKIIMDLNHIDPTTKLFNIGGWSAGDTDVLIKEIKKCELICPNCHRLKTITQSDNYLHRIKEA